MLSLPMQHVWAWRAVTTRYVDAKWYRYDCMERKRSQRVPGVVTMIPGGLPSPLGRSAILASTAASLLLMRIFSLHAFIAPRESSPSTQEIG